MRITKNKILHLLILLSISCLSFSQTLLNNGGQINSTQGSFIYVNGSVENQNSGQFVVDENAGVNAELYVTGDITNDATISDNGHIRLLGNWFDNGVFNGGVGTVFLEGAAQLLGGSSQTVFNNLTLDGTGTKTQTIDKFATGILDLKHLELRTETNTFFMQNQNPNAILRTTGFVSSLNGGKLSRVTNQNTVYLYPVGSSLGVSRYRPVEITPNSSTNNTYAVRLANLDANIEGYNRTEHEIEICQLNDLFYHQIARTSGSAAADIKIAFDNVADGDWEGISNWKTPLSEWQIVDGSYVTAGSPYDKAIKDGWNDYLSEPYILFKANVTLTFNQLGPFCAHTTATALPLVSNEGITGTWSPALINTNNAGFYDYVFTPNTGQGCFLSYTMTIEIENCCSMSIIANATNPLCNGQNGLITMTQTGGINPITYTFNGVSGGASYSAPSGNYVIIATDVFGCTASTTASITQPTQLQVFLSSVPAQCGGNGGSAFASIGGGTPSYDFLWLPGGQTLNNVTNQDPGQYSVIVTDNNNCTVTQSVTIGISGSINATITQSHPISCKAGNDGIIEIGNSNGADPIVYEWNNGATGPILYNLSSGTYTVNINDGWGCSGVASTFLADPPAIIASETYTSITCFGLSNGSINTSVTGGTPPYDYFWNTGATTPLVTNLIAGTYFLSITDAHGCTYNKTFTLIQPSDLAFENQISNITCFGNNDGSISLNANGGTEPYNYSISQVGLSGSGSAFYNLAAGYYNVIVTDHNLCTDSASVVISEPAPISASYTYSNPSCIGNTDGYVSLDVIGGTAPYLFGWDKYYVDMPLISGLIQGSYNILITDANNCEYAINAIVLTDIDEDCIRIPNAFTPNGDGPNDQWIIHNIELFPNAYISVYNRWGQLIYAGRGDSEAWDGTFNGRLVPAGSYLYTVQLYNRNADYTGIVTVVY